jgi:phosphatidylserine/phosphatidylglycerophosphate/cardiolipin synthase-like enzyme
MRSGGPPLDIVIVLPQKSAGFKERISIGVYQARILERLGKVAAETGHRLGIYYSAAPGKDGDLPVFVHAKVLAVDDRFLLVSSANLSNRSMGFDTELGLAWEAPQPNESLRYARVSLLREHCGLDEGLVDNLGLVDQLDALARSEQHRLRLHHRNADEKPGRWLSHLIPDETMFDPDDPQSMKEALPEPQTWLDRLIGDPVHHVVRKLRSGTKRRR